MASFFLILLIGFYLVLSPAKYIGNVLLMCPPAKRDRVAQVLCMQGRALRLWLLSRLVSMVFVGVSVALGLFFGFVGVEWLGEGLGFFLPSRTLRAKEEIL